MSNDDFDPRLTVCVGDVQNQPDCDAVAIAIARTMSGGRPRWPPKWDWRAQEPWNQPKRPLRLSQALVDPAFDGVASPWVIFVRMPAWGEEVDKQAATAKGIQSILTHAETRGFKRIAMPPFGPGVFFVPPEVAPLLMAQAIQKHLLQSAVEEVRIVVPGETIKRVFDVALGRQQSGPTTA